VKGENHARLDVYRYALVYGIGHVRITDELTRENWLQKAVVRQGPTSIYYTYILYAGATPEEDPWMVEVNGNEVNWEYFPRRLQPVVCRPRRRASVRQWRGRFLLRSEYRSGEAVVLARRTSARVAHHYRIWSPPSIEGRREALRGVMIEPLDADFADMRGTERTENEETERGSGGASI
jgi:hypothetical protein